MAMAWRAPFPSHYAPDHGNPTIRVPGSVVTPYDDGELPRLAELRASSGLKLPDCLRAGCWQFIAGKPRNL